MAHEYNESIIRSNNDSGYNLTNQPDFDSFMFPDLELPFHSKSVLITFYTLAALLSLTGNIVVILVLCLGKHSKTILDIFLINLSVADTCMACFCIPFSFTKSMLGHWVFGAVMCPLVLFVQVTSIAVSIFTNTVIGYDR